MNMEGDRITVEEVEQPKTKITISISEPDRVELWEELRTLIDELAQRGKNKEKAIQTKYPLIWQLIRGIRIKE